jgi:NADH-quinone oxidoreductase subunit L
MLNLLWLIPVFPLAGFVMLALAGGRLSRSGVAVVGTGSIGLAALVAILIGIDFIATPPPQYAYRQVLWTWINVAGFAPRIALYLDALSLVMVLVVTVVGFLIHLYSTEFMLSSHSPSPTSGRGEQDESPGDSARMGYKRFFTYMNLFVASMCTLLLADNLLLLYLGWEGVGLCSYLLIGFWYRDPANGLAARKAFVVTRVGDVAMAIGLFLLFTHLGTLDIQPLMQQATLQWPAGSALPIAAAALLLGGAVGKSAQLPLQTWLPDAMAGPTPVSALIHAATMVTAGVYLIARTHVLYALAPPVLLTVAVIGALTLLIAGFSALVQDDIKRVLAYSTISQIGYMFLALGVGAWSAAIFHFMTHAFFKALLFLCAGAVIASLHEEHNIFRMGGLRKQLPAVFWTFLIGSASLAALPLVTAGFYSKDQILWQSWSSSQGNPWLWLAGWVGALLTGLYIFRVVFIAFFGEARSAPGKLPGPRMMIPLIALAVLSVAGGWLELPPLLGQLTLFSNFVHTALPPTPIAHAAGNIELTLSLLAAVASLAGIGIAYLLYLRHPHALEQFAQSAPIAALRAFWHAGWGFDTLYDRVFVRPWLWLARTNRHDFIDTLFGGLAQLCRFFYRALSATQSGQMRRYAAGIAAGSIVLLFISVFA